MKTNKVMMIFGLAAGVAASAQAREVELSEINNKIYKGCTYDTAARAVSCIRKDNSRDYFHKAYSQCPGNQIEGNYKLGKLPSEAGPCIIWDEENPMYRHMVPVSRTNKSK